VKVLQLNRIRSGLVVLTVVAAVVGTACASDPENTRIDGPVDLSVKSRPGRPEGGIYLNGGTYDLVDIAFQNGECRIETGSGLEEFMRLVDPFDPKNANPDSTDIPLEASHLDTVRSFVEALELRVDSAGSTLVIGTGDDASQSLPLTGRVSGGAVDTLTATTAIQGVDERTVDLRVQNPEGPPGVDQPTSAAAVTTEWAEAPLVPTWVYPVEQGAGRCKATGTATLVRTGGPLPPAPPAPSGQSDVLAVSPPAAQGTPLAAATDLIGTLTWRPPANPDDRSLTMALPDGARAGQGVLTEAGGGWAVFVKGDSGGLDFRIRAWKIEDGRVSGSLLAGDGDAVSTANVDLAG